MCDLCFQSKYRTKTNIKCFLIIIAEAPCFVSMNNGPAVSTKKLRKSVYGNSPLCHRKPIPLSFIIIIHQLYEHTTVMATSLLRSTLRSANRWTTGLQKRHPGSIFREQIRPITTALNSRNNVQNITNITTVNSAKAFAAKRSYADQVSFTNTQ